MFSLKINKRGGGGGPNKVRGDWKKIEKLISGLGKGGRGAFIRHLRVFDKILVKIL